MTAPNVPPVPSEVTEDLATKLVTEHLADGKIVTEPEATYLAEEVAEGHAHNINEARVQIGLAQLPTLPASPDGTGNPTFTVGAAPTTPPVILPIPPASAPVEHHVSFWSSFWSYFSHAAVVTGHSLTNPAVLAAAAPFVPPKYQGIVGAIGVIEQVAEAPSTPAQ